MPPPFRELLQAQSAALLPHTDFRFDLGIHKATRLKQALGRKARSTLLNSKTAQAHAQRLYDKFNGRWGRLSKAEAQRRLRFLTVLHEVVAFGNDPNAIIESVVEMNRKIADSFSRVKGRVTLLGAVEIEVVSFSLMRRQASTTNEQRKLNVLTKMAPSIRNTVFTAAQSPKHFAQQSHALIHLHAIVDLGAHPDITESQIVSVLQREWREPYQVELKALFKSPSLEENLKGLATYMTKGGNKDLRYNIQFGKDEPDALDGKMRLGLGRKDKMAGEEDGAVEDVRSLTLGEIRVLGTAYDVLMGGTKARNGYLVEVPRSTIRRRTFGSRRRRSTP